MDDSKRRAELTESLKELPEVFTAAGRRPAIDQLERDRAAAGAFPGGNELKAGDWVEHPRGRCRVVEVEAPRVLLESEEGPIELSLDELRFRPDAIEGGEPVFSMAPK